MTRTASLLVAVTAALTLAAAPALAQGERGQERGQSNPRSGGGHPSAGTAVARPSGGGSGGGASRPAGGGNVSAPGPRSSGVRSAPRSGSPQGARGPRATPRAGTVSGRAAPSGRAAGVSPSNDTRRPDRELPEYSRPRQGRPVIGQAIPRSERPVVRPPGGGYYPGYPWYGYGYGYPYYGYYGSFGLGFFYYDPYWWGSGTYAGGGGYSTDTGAVRLKVKPRDAQVYVDGYFVGIVDSFDGTFQKLKLLSGGHRLEIRLDGYETLSFDVLITPNETITYTGQLNKLQ